MNIDTMTEREIDAAISKHTYNNNPVLRNRIVRSDKTWIYATPNGANGFDWFAGDECVPHYTTDANATREMEAELQRRNLWHEYTCQLYAVATHNYLNTNNLTVEELFALATATPAERCRAALRVVLGRDNG